MAVSPIEDPMGSVLVQGTRGWTRSKRRTPDFEIVRGRNTTIGNDYGYLEDKVTSGEQEAGPSPILVRGRLLMCSRATGQRHPWCVQALV